MSETNINEISTEESKKIWIPLAQAKLSQELQRQEELIWWTSLFYNKPPIKEEQKK